MQLLVTLNQTLMPVEAFELGAGRREAVKADAAIDRAERGVHPLFTKHAAEVDHKLFQLQLIIQHHFQHHINCLIKQTALDRVVVELQEGLNQFFRFVILLQSQIDQQFELQNRQLPPGRIVIKLNADQGGDIGVIVKLAFSLP